MESWLMIGTLLILLVVCIGILILLLWDIRKMTMQLENIINQFGTNELIRTNTHGKTLTRFVAKINQLIQLFKQDQQQARTREEKLKQEITNISHDFRTPLTSIKGFAELLTNPTLSEAEKQEYLIIIQNKINHLTMVTEAFYELSQIDSLDKPLEMEMQHVDEIVVDTILMFYDDFEKKRLDVQIDDASIPPILADERATKRVVINIIQNALRYANRYFTIQWIEDKNGIGFRAINDVAEDDVSEIHRIFDRTFRLETSRQDGQLGLGLHIVKQLMSKQRGNVTAEIDNNEFKIEVWFRKWNENEYPLG